MAFNWPRSRAFWATSLSAGSLAAWCWWDRLQAKQMYQMYLDEAKQLGETPHPISLDGSASVPLRCVTMVLATTEADEAEALKRHRRVFREHVAPLFTQAGIDYSLIEVKKEEKEGEAEGEGDAAALKNLPRTALEGVRHRLTAWLQDDRVIQEGLVGLNVGSYGALIEGLIPLAYDKGMPRLALINCDLGGRLRDRLYWALHRRLLVERIGGECMRVIREQVRPVPLTEALPQLQIYGQNQDQDVIKKKIALFYQ